MSVLNILEEKLAETKKQGRFREFLNLERGVQDKPWATSHGQQGERRLNVWCSNDYLAMSHHPKVLLATTEAVNRVGLGTCGARSISGTSVYHSELETLLASAYGKESALLFTTGFGANDATLSTLCDAIPDLIVFSDELNHASMIYGIRYSKAEKKIFRHNDVAHLAELLQAADPARPKLIAFESLYSMDGDFAPLAQIVALAEQYQALTYLDESTPPASMANGGWATPNSWACWIKSPLFRAVSASLTVRRAAISPHPARWWRRCAAGPRHSSSAPRHRRRWWPPRWPVLNTTSSMTPSASTCWRSSII